MFVLIVFALKSSSLSFLPAHIGEGKYSNRSGQQSRCWAVEVGGSWWSMLLTVDGGTWVGGNDVSSRSKRQHVSGWRREGGNGEEERDGGVGEGSNYIWVGESGEGDVVVVDNDSDLFQGVEG